MRHPKGVSGLTLVEILVGLMVSAILLTVLVQLFLVSTRTGAEELARSSGETSALLALRAVGRDLQTTTPAGISLITSGDRLVVHPVDTVLANRQVTYRNRLLLWAFEPEEGELRRLTYDTFFTPFDLRPHRLTETEVQELSVDPGAATSLVTKNVSAFSVHNPPGVTVPSVGAPLEIALSVTVEGAETRKQVALKQSVWIRSSGN